MASEWPGFDALFLQLQKVYIVRGSKQLGEKGKKVDIIPGKEAFHAMELRRPHFWAYRAFFNHFYYCKSKMESGSGYKLTFWHSFQTKNINYILMLIFIQWEKYILFLIRRSSIILLLWTKGKSKKYLRL